MTDLTTISLGAGLQSSLLCEMVMAGELPPVDYVIFADTGDEPDYVYQQVEYLRGRLAGAGVPLVTVSAGDLVSDIYGPGRFAAIPVFTKQTKPVSGFGLEAEMYQIGRMKRQCTTDYKVVPIERFIRETLIERGKAKRDKTGSIRVAPGVRVETWLGISYDEVQRMKRNKTTWITNRWPLIEKRMTRQLCRQWFTARGLPVPRKSSCRICPYHNDSYYQDMRVNRPDDWQHVAAFDADLRGEGLRLAATAKGELYLHSSCVPLADIDFSPDNGQLPLIEDGDICDEGYCFV
jgi:hypothetical protein